jgi:hypothetical protein
VHEQIIIKDALDLATAAANKLQTNAQNEPSNLDYMLIRQTLVIMTV